ncbi:MAG: hypothetical protein O7J95_05715, partial [Planctomycetota bacterium]|nr:hypothetical protein [Planctomycetota bacterium]
MSEQESPSQIVPVLVAALVCDVAVPDPVTGKKNLIGIFDRIAIRNFPITRPVSLYMKLSDAEGLYNMEVRYVELKTDEVLGTATGTFTLENRLNSFDFFL